MSVNDQLAEIISILESVLAGKIDPNSALQKWPNIDGETDVTVKAVWHDLSHFANDLDIRQKDKGYEAYQRGLLEAGIAKIRKRAETK